MGLREYERKRDFKRTPEPRGRVHGARGKLRYVIQKHAASRLHYDFRLELDGVLKSWAVPKGPSLDPQEKRLAVQVEDHPIEYGSFEGTIPEGEYGGGTVLLWDRGTWKPLGDPERDLAEGRLKFELQGEKLRGKWMLVRMGGRAGEGGKNWLLIKERDEYARPTRAGDVLEDQPLSVASGRDLDEIAGAQGRVWSSDRPAKPATGRLARRRLALATPAPAEAGPTRPGASRSGAAGTPTSKQGAAAASKRIAARAATNGKAAAPKRATARATRRAPALDPGSIEGARRAPLPRTLEPEKATLVAAVPEGDEWLHEIKFDGYRILARLDGGKVRLLSRRGLDWSDPFAGVAEAVAALPAKTALLDGEVVALAPDGTSRFQLLQGAPRGSAPLVYYVFDLIHLDGWDLRGAALTARKEVLAGLVPPGGKETLRYSDHVAGRGQEFYRAACRHGLEGVVSKRGDSTYRSGRGRDWLKTKCLQRQEFVIGGWTEPEGSRSGFGALLLGVYDPEGRLLYAGKVGTGFDDATLRDLARRFKQLGRPTPPFANPPRGRDLHWLDPKLVAEVSFTEWTQDGRLRHPAFQGLREDKPAREVVREQPQSPPASDEPPADSTRSRASRAAGGTTPASTATRRRAAAARKGAKSGASKSPRTAAAAKPGRAREDLAPAGVRLTNPGRVLWPEIGATKAELAKYYETVADRMLPEIAERPLMLKRCPGGWDQECFFQKHVNQTTPDTVDSVEVSESGGKARYLMVRDRPGLMSLVQMGALEIHVWGSRARTIERPDRLVFDLDPDPAVPWARVIEAARLLRERLAALELVSVVMTTGGKGLHVVVPLAPRAEWDEVREFCRAVAQRMVDEAPERYTATLSKAKRRGRILVDWLRNGRGATAIAPWSTRARAGAPVATPIAWEELEPGLRPDAFTIRNLPARLARLRRDPWAAARATRQSLTAAIRRAAASR